MKRTKWIVGLSIASVMALSGTAFALNSGSVVAQAVGQTLGLAPTVATTQNQGTVADPNGSSTVNASSPATNQSTVQSTQLVTSQSTNTTPSSPNNNSNGATTPWSNGFAGGYGMMGGFSANGYGGGYGMMGGFGANGYDGG